MSSPDNIDGLRRLFIALDLPDKIKSAMTNIIADLSGASDSTTTGDKRTVKWVKPENTHLTVKFLGDTPEKKIDSLIEALAEVSASEVFANPYRLCLSQLGAFPNLSRPRVFWVGLSGEGMTALAQLAREIDSALAPLGFTGEDREFRPHLTLGRPRPKTDVSVICYRVRGYQLQEIDFEVNKLTLYQSTLTPQGPIYRDLKSWRAGDLRFGD